MKNIKEILVCGGEGGSVTLIKENETFFYRTDETTFRIHPSNYVFYDMIWLFTFGGINYMYYDKKGECFVDA